MFVLEINFHDGVSQPEMLLIRRPRAIIGASEFAHVVIDGAARSFYELRVSRGIGREFRCQPISRHDAEQPMPAFLDGVYHSEATFDLGGISAHLTAVDIDLQLSASESPDRASLRVLRRALTIASPQFPAIALLGAVPLFVSFPVDQPLFAGRSRKCGLRIDSAEVSSEHARMGYNDGSFWVEDLGSSNGTFVSGERISGRRILAVEETVTLASDFVLAGARNEKDAQLLHQRPLSSGVVKTVAREKFPCLLASSELVRPQRLFLSQGAKVTIGRDPANDVWIGASHVSRNHAEIVCPLRGAIELFDHSSNGIVCNGERIEREKAVLLNEALSILDFGGNVTLAVCLSEDAEKKYHAEQEEIHSAATATKSNTKPVTDTSQMERMQDELERIEPLRAGAFQRFAERVGNQVQNLRGTPPQGNSVRGTETAPSGTMVVQPGEGQQARPFLAVTVFGKILLIVSVVGLLAIIAWFVYMNIFSLHGRGVVL